MIVITAAVATRRRAPVVAKPSESNEESKIEVMGPGAAPASRGAGFGKTVVSVGATLISVGTRLISFGLVIWAGFSVIRWGIRLAAPAFSSMTGGGNMEAGGAHPVMEVAAA